MKTELYVQILPQRHPWDPDRVSSVRVGKVTKRHPGDPEPGAVLAKVVLDVPAEHFLARVVEVEVPAPTAIRAVS